MLENIIIITVLVILCGVVISNSGNKVYEERYKKYSNYLCEANHTPFEFLNYLIENNKYKIRIILSQSETEENYYTSHNKSITISEETAQSESITSYAIIAHEFGHSIQDCTNERKYRIYQKLRVFSAIFGKFSLPLIIIGIFCGILFNRLLGIGLVAFGILFFLFIFFEQMLAVIIEFEASNYGIKEMKKSNFFSKKEIKRAKKFLSGAGFTYFARFCALIFSWTFLVPKYK